MCGICGSVGLSRPGLIEAMAATQAHRGPDDSGVYRALDEGLGPVEFGHRRLSIIDLSGGHQPMSTPDGMYTIVFNGEIYNYRELRERLAHGGVSFQTQSDTEVLLRLYEQHGPDCLRHLNGMFAFAVHDRRAHEVFVARDRVGIKPLYYAHVENGVLFASEAKALLRHGAVDPAINPHAIHDYLGLRYVPGHTTMIRSVKRLGPGEYLFIRPGSTTRTTWWRPPTHDAGHPRSEDEYLEELAELMQRSVRRRLITDVPFGAYLSGGLDSSLIVALMTREGNAAVKTFSVGFDYEYDELVDAANTAELLGCDHHEVACRAQDVALLPEVVYHSDDPMGDAISIPMFRLAREARKEVTVILTGEGADELFAGYLFHKVMWAADLYRRTIPGAVRRWIVRPLLGAAPVSMLNLAFRYPAHLGRRGKLKALDYLDLVGNASQDEGYRHLISLFDERDTGAIYTSDFTALLRDEARNWTPSVDTDGSSFDQMIRLQFGHWLPDNMLMRNDKMCMASGVEGRVPYLDHEVVEFSLRIPKRHRLRGLTGKYLLRRLAERVLPKTTAHRRKMPFYVPIEKYFQQAEFIEMAEDLLGESSVRRRGILRPDAVAELRRAMRANEFLLVKQVYSLMVLELWFRTFADRMSGNSHV